MYRVYAEWTHWFLQDSVVCVIVIFSELVANLHLCPESSSSPRGWGVGGLTAAEACSCWLFFSWPNGFTWMMFAVLTSGHQPAGGPGQIETTCSYSPAR